MSIRHGFAALLMAMSALPLAAQTPRLAVTVYQGTFATVNSYIVSNGKSLLVIDTQRKSAEARKLVDRIKAIGLPVDLILITHGHTDHFTGMPVLQQAFPGARIVVATTAIRADIKAYAIYMDGLGATAAEPVLEPALKPRSATNPGGFDYENAIHILPGHTILMKGGGKLRLTTDYPATEAPHMTTIYSRSLNALFLSDLGYNKVHCWLGDDLTRHDIANWRATLVRIKARYGPLRPVIYPGHGDPGDIGMLDREIAYLDDFVRVTGSATSRQQAFDAMVALYPDYKEANFFLKYSIEHFVVLQSRPTDTRNQRLPL